MSDQQTVTIDNKHYNFNDLNDNARAQLDNLRFIDKELQQLGNQTALAETAKVAYTRALAEVLPKQKAAANKKKDVVTVDGEKYSLEDFSEQGKAQLLNIQFADQEITRLKNLQVVLQVARVQYGKVLSDELAAIKPVTAQ